MTTTSDIITQLQQHANPTNVAGMARFGARPTNALGISIPTLRTLAKQYKRNHSLALALWSTSLHEARILASMIADPKLVTPELMEDWVKDFDSWDLCDQVCNNLFARTPYAFTNAQEWCHREPEYTRRAAFVLQANLAVHDKKAPNTSFHPFFPLIHQYATDERNFVKKAVNWSLRQIGKRNSDLHPLAISCAQSLLLLNSKSAHWIARDALRELQQKSRSSPSH